MGASVVNIASIGQCGKVVYGFAKKDLDGPNQEYRIPGEIDIHGNHDKDIDEH